MEITAEDLLWIHHSHSRKKLKCSYGWNFERHRQQSLTCRTHRLKIPTYVLNTRRIVVKYYLARPTGNYPTLQPLSSLGFQEPFLQSVSHFEIRAVICCVCQQNLPSAFEISLPVFVLLPSLRISFEVSEYRPYVEGGQPIVAFY